MDTKPDQSNLKETQLSTEPEELISVTHHTAKINGKEISYTASVGRMILKEEIYQKDGDKKDTFDGNKSRAAIFYVAYTLDNVKAESSRSLTFSFNGGPGSASIWVHMGFLGPRRVELDQEGNPVSLPSSLKDNEFSILDMTDLVFIDPIGTGFSRAVEGNKEKDFFGYKADIESVGEFIRRYVTENKRWASKKYIAGESYGTTRSTGLADYLSDKFGLYLNGIILISTALDFMSLDFNPGNDLPYALYLPTYASDAWYHHKLSEKNQSRSLKDFLNEVCDFAGNEYLQALFQGDRLSDSVKNHIAQKLSEYTGIRKEWILEANLRIEQERFCKELMRDQRRTVGRLDGRYLGIDHDAAGEKTEDDPSSYQVTGAFVGAFIDYVTRELGYSTDIPYRHSTDLWRNWDYKEFENMYLQLQETLRKAMTRNKFMKVWVLDGYYDLATPFYAEEYVFSHLMLDSSLKENLTTTYYEAGHMMYLHEPSLKKFRSDAERFFKNS